MDVTVDEVVGASLDSGGLRGLGRLLLHSLDLLGLPVTLCAPRPFGLPEHRNPLR
jgi:hypothetical protein